MGINERPTQAFLDTLEKHLGFSVPRRPRHNAVAAINAMLTGQARVFIGLSGNFA